MGRNKKHTPGPWRLLDERRNIHYRTADPGGYERIMQHCWYIEGDANNHPEAGTSAPFVCDLITAIDGHREGDGRANARLIAAAPDLLAACENFYYGRKDNKECEAEMRAAIRKATL